MTPSTSTKVDTVIKLPAKILSRSTDIYFKHQIAKVEEHCFRKGPVAAHLYLDSNQAPYFFVAFPAGNSGVGMWFDTPDKNVFLSAVRPPHAITRSQLNGIEVDLKSGAKSLKIKTAVLGSMRFIRDAELQQPIPKVIQKNTVVTSDHVIVMDRESLNKMASYRLELELLGDTKMVQHEGAIELVAQSNIKFRLRAMTSERPLTPLKPSSVFKKQYLSKIDPKELQAFSFLLYREKFAAGSPRYLNQFGRDSLITLRVLMDAMKPEAVENLISMTLNGAHPVDGMISHEQHEGDFASFVRKQKHQNVIGVTSPIEDYKMIDDDFIFTIVLAEYMKRYPMRVADFLDRRDSRGISHRRLVQNNFRYVRKMTKAFFQDPIYTNLVHLKDGETTGQWRDSEYGLGGGSYPFDVNVALVPGALRGLSEIYDNEHLEFFSPKTAALMDKIFRVWNEKAEPLFEVRIPKNTIPNYGEKYFANLHLDPKDLPDSPEQDLRFPAIAINDAGEKIPVMHSDDSMMMTFGYPSENYMRSVNQRVQHQFPYGLRTPVGILIANPVFARPLLQSHFDEHQYHGRTSWAMQEDLLIYGFDRQLAIGQWSNETIEEINHSVHEVAKVIKVKGHMGGNEVFSILLVNGRYLALPFAGSAKSNSNQLWSHLRIASPPLEDI